MSSSSRRRCSARCCSMLVRLGTPAATGSGGPPGRGAPMPGPQRRPRAHRSRRTRAARPTPAGRRPGRHPRRRRELGLELAGSAATAATRATTGCHLGQRHLGGDVVAAELFAAMFAARGALAPIAIELAVRIQIVGFEIAIDALAPRACGAARAGRTRPRPAGPRPPEEPPSAPARPLAARHTGRAALPSATFPHALPAVRQIPGPLQLSAASGSTTTGAARHSRLLSFAANWQSCNVTRSPEPGPRA